MKVTVICTKSKPVDLRCFGFDTKNTVCEVCSPVSVRFTRRYVYIHYKDGLMTVYKRGAVNLVIEDEEI